MYTGIPSKTWEVDLENTGLPGLGKMETCIIDDWTLKENPRGLKMSEHLNIIKYKRNIKSPFCELHF